MDERVLGPVRGHYVASFAARVGDLGQRFLGYWKICASRPDSFFAQPGDLTGYCPTNAGTAEAALLQAEGLALAALRDLPEGPCVPRTDGQLSALMYVSTARDPAILGADALGELLVSARARNGRLAVTGVLLAFQGRFMQYIEGPRPQVELVYRSVQTDPRHHALVELLREPIAQREFADWAMAYACPEVQDHDPRRVLPALFGGDSVARRLLRGFVERAA